MPPSVTKSPRARRDLVEHFLVIGRDSVSAARRFIQAADKAIENLARMPEIGSPWRSKDPALAGLRVGSIRRFEKYLIFYRPISDGIEVIRVLHGARDIDAVLEAPQS